MQSEEERAFDTLADFARRYADGDSLDRDNFREAYKVILAAITELVQARQRIAELQAQVEAMESAAMDRAVEREKVRATLKTIVWWKDFPPTDDPTYGYGAKWKSNGERDYMRGLAAKALEYVELICPIRPKKGARNEG